MSLVLILVLSYGSSSNQWKRNERGKGGVLRLGAINAKQSRPKQQRFERFVANLSLSTE